MQNITPMKTYEKAGQYLIASWLMVIGRFSMIAWFTCILLLSKGRMSELLHNILYDLQILSGALWIISILSSLGLTIPLRCNSCGNRIAVITSYAKVSPDYIAREQAQSRKNKFINFFIPIELFSKRVHCVRCDQEYSLKEPQR